jgi:hypothetical protein
MPTPELIEKAQSIFKLRADDKSRALNELDVPQLLSIVDYFKMPLINRTDKRQIVVAMLRYTENKMMSREEFLSNLTIESLYNKPPEATKSILNGLSEKELEDFITFNHLESFKQNTKTATVNTLYNHILEMYCTSRTEKVRLILKDKIAEIKNARPDLISELSLDSPLLTVTKGKMYGIYILNSNNTIQEVSFDNPLVQEGWFDHCMNPQKFHQLAKQLGCEYDNETFAYICHQWVENALRSDWTKLHKYLPTEGM